MIRLLFFLAQCTFWVIYYMLVLVALWSGLDWPERSRAYIGDMDLVSSGSRLRDLGLRVTDPRLRLLGDLTAAGPVR